MGLHMTAIEPLQIASLQWDYPVSFHPSFTEGIDALGDLREAYVIVDAQVLALHGDALVGLTSRFPTLAIEATEEAKSFTGVGHLVDWLIEQRAVRSSTLIAVGGGCIQDLVSFTAHIYYRGVNWVFLPTTVLSQADSCIGAKSGINVLPFKNQLGVLHSPRQVRICEEFLSTLPEVEIASGYGEIVKLAVTSSRHFLGLLESSLSDGGLRNPHLLALERASLAAKQEIIEEDEYETDLRRVLNYGHSFGHALEALAGHQVPHGLGVLWGIDVINALGVTWGMTPPELAQRMHDLIARNFTYTLPISPSAEELIDMIGRDKKVAHGKMHFAVLRGEGDIVIEPRALDADLTTQVREVLSEDRVFASR
jgi:3-dehydroquinate synthase